MKVISMFDQRTLTQLISDWEAVFYRHCRSILSLRIDRGNGAFARNYRRFLWTFNKLYSKDPLAVSYYIDNIYERWFDFYYLYYYFNVSKVYVGRMSTIDQIAMHERGKREHKELGKDMETYRDDMDYLPYRQ